ncbi:MAG: caspase family protein, partial [Alphaproteobacteria bacterium]
ALIQQCLKEAGYLKAATATRMTKRAWTAFWFFKQDYKIGSTPKGVLDARAQRKLFTLCPLAGRAVGLGARPVIARAAPATGEGGAAVISDQPKVAAVPRRIYARPEAGCLPDDLYRLVTSAYGSRPGLKRCKHVCVSIPKGLPQREIVSLEARGVSWCRACLEIGSQMPLDDILRIERGANVQICTRPPARLPRWERADRAPHVAYTRVRELYRTLPTADAHAGSIAIVIGNKNYQGGFPANETAHNNASAIYALLSEHLGYAQERIIDLRDATLEEMTQLFDPASDDRHSLKAMLAAAPEADVIVYYAGHATTALDGSQSYLLPVDAVEHREERTGYPLSRLYEN